MPRGRLYQATSLADAVAALTDFGAHGAPLAGATWIMRAPIRGEHVSLSYVAVGKLPELRGVEITDGEISIGAGVTHAELVAALGNLHGCEGLVAAAGSAANPAIRHMATIGGNLCAWKFAASDLVPALLCLDAVVAIDSPDGPARLALEMFLRRRSTLAPGTILTRIGFTPMPWRFAHARLPLRKAGDYPVAIVSMGARFGAGGIIEDMRVAVGSVEADARRWPALEAALIGRPADSGRAAEAATAHAGDFAGRDGIEAPGWYRIAVLPTLVGRAMQALLARS